MNEKQRLEELINYDILDTAPEKALDDITSIAATLCDTPIGLITLLDDSRQWFMSKVGLDVDQTAKKDSFCQYTLKNAGDIFVIEDALKDERFIDNVLVTGPPHIRFYAGAPLITPSGNIIGSLCVIDKKPKRMKERQKRALVMLAKQVMDFLNARKIIISQLKCIENNSEKLKNLTDQAPGVIYQFEMKENGEMSFPYISKGIKNLHPSLDPEVIKKDPHLAFSVVHPDDLPIMMKSIQLSFENLTEWNSEYRVVCEDGSIEWHMGKAKAKKNEDGSVTWFGTFQNITSRVEYMRTMEQIAFDISHVLRRPVSTLLGLTSIIEREGEMDEQKLKEYSGYIRTVAREMDTFTRRLNETYQSKDLLINGSGAFDVSRNKEPE